MTQHEVNCAVANVTGESLRTIESLGFSIADPDLASFDPEPYAGINVLPQTIDWDQLDAQRVAWLPQRQGRRMAA